MPVVINPICRKPRMLLKLNNSYLRNLNKERAAYEKDIIAENLKNAGDAVLGIPELFTGRKV